MATALKMPCDDADEDLEALRMAALQTIGVKRVATSHSIMTVPSFQKLSVIPPKLFHAPSSRPLLGQDLSNNYVREECNPNLISIVPVGGEVPQFVCGRGGRRGKGRYNNPVRPFQPNRFAAPPPPPRLAVPIMPFKQEEKTEEMVTEEVAEHGASTKFSRFRDSDSESDDDSISSKRGRHDESVKSEEEDDDKSEEKEENGEEDSLDRLMDEMEQEMNNPGSLQSKTKKGKQKKVKTVAVAVEHLLVKTSPADERDVKIDYEVVIETKTAIVEPLIPVHKIKVEKPDPPLLPRPAIVHLPVLPLKQPVKAQSSLHKIKVEKEDSPCPVFFHPSSSACQPNSPIHSRSVSPIEVKPPSPVVISDSPPLRTHTPPQQSPSRSPSPAQCSAPQSYQSKSPASPWSRSRSRSPPVQRRNVPNSPRRRPPPPLCRRRSDSPHRSHQRRWSPARCRRRKSPSYLRAPAKRRDERRCSWSRSPSLSLSPSPERRTKVASDGLASYRTRHRSPLRVERPRTIGNTATIRPLTPLTHLGVDARSRKDADRLDRVDRLDRAACLDRVDRLDRTDRLGRADRLDRAVRPGRADLLVRADRRNRADCSVRVDHPDGAVKRKTLSLQTNKKETRKDSAKRRGKRKCEVVLPRMIVSDDPVLEARRKKFESNNVVCPQKRTLCLKRSISQLERTSPNRSIDKACNTEDVLDLGITGGWSTDDEDMEAAGIVTGKKVEQGVSDHEHPSTPDCSPPQKPLIKEKWIEQGARAKTQKRKTAKRRRAAAAALVRSDESGGEEEKSEIAASERQQSRQSEADDTDLRDALRRRRAERITECDRLQPPSRLIQTAFQGAIGRDKMSTKRVESKAVVTSSLKKVCLQPLPPEPLVEKPKELMFGEKLDGRRVLLLKRTTLASRPKRRMSTAISVMIQEEDAELSDSDEARGARTDEIDYRTSVLQSRLPVHLRLGGAPTKSRSARRSRTRRPNQV